MCFQDAPVYQSQNCGAHMNANHLNIASFIVTLNVAMSVVVKSLA
jgi:hypothetical protein